MESKSYTCMQSIKEYYGIRQGKQLYYLHNLYTGPESLSKFIGVYSIPKVPYFTFTFDRDSSFSIVNSLKYCRGWRSTLNLRGILSTRILNIPEFIKHIKNQWKIYHNYGYEKFPLIHILGCEKIETRYNNQQSNEIPDSVLESIISQVNSPVTLPLLTHFTYVNTYHVFWNETNLKIPDLPQWLNTLYQRSFERRYFQALFSSSKEIKFIPQALLHFIATYL